MPGRHEPHTNTDRTQRTDIHSFRRAFVTALKRAKVGAREPCGPLTIAYGEYSLKSMWTIVEEHDAAKTLDKLQPKLAEKYAFWCAIVRQSGPQGLRAIKSFHDEKLAGRLAHLRSSRLRQRWRILYRVEADVVTVYVERITPHDYRP